jgi:cell fate (sporulation/competence/biofilm development) regulator YlbF (YheA/YmcA/DUF963 family)
MKPIPIQQEESPVIRKTKELCQAILDHPAYQEMRRTITQFLGDEQMRSQYHRLCDLQDQLHEKHENGELLTDADLLEFEREEHKFLSHPLAQSFMEAQRALHKIEKTISAYVRKTFELGRLPEDSDFDSGGCGPKCGCR